MPELTPNIGVNSGVKHELTPNFDVTPELN